MATTEDRPTPSTHVRQALQEHRRLHAGARKTLEYLNGTRTKQQLDLQTDILAAFRVAGGQLALRYEHDKTTEYVFATSDSTRAVASAYYKDRSGAQVENLAFPVEDLKRDRGIPDPDDFVHLAYELPGDRPADAHPSGGAE